MDIASNINKKIIIIAAIALVAVVVFGVAGYFYWNWLERARILKGLENSGVVDRALEDATKGVLPEIQTNPLENKPDINPASAGNPIKNIKTNPFE